MYGARSYYHLDPSRFAKVPGGRSDTTKISARPIAAGRIGALADAPIRCGVKAALMALALAALTACEPAPLSPPNSASRTWPAGVVLAIDGIAIHAAEVDAASAAVQLIEPAVSSPQLRRLALSNLVLPRVLAQAIDPAGREDALRTAREKLERIRAGGDGPPRPDGLVGEKVEGLWTDIGLGNWYAALELPDGEWSEPIEDAGGFLLMRRLWRRDGPVPMATAVAVDALRFDWIEPRERRARLDRALDECKLEIVDPAWREIVPELYQYRMGARQ